MTNSKYFIRRINAIFLDNVGFGVVNINDKKKHVCEIWFQMAVSAQYSGERRIVINDYSDVRSFDGEAVNIEDYRNLLEDFLNQHFVIDKNESIFMLNPIHEDEE